MENKERKETRKEVERLPYEQYRDNGRKSNTRKINKPNSFKKKIYSLIKQATEEDELLGRSLSIMFLVNHISAHKPLPIFKYFCRHHRCRIFVSNYS